MGLAATLQHPHGIPLGTQEEVKRALTAAFPKIRFSLRPSGAEKLQAALDMGVSLPEEIQEELADRPALLCGEFQTADFSVQFLFPPDGPVTQVEVLHHGSTAVSAPRFQHLRETTGWEMAME